MKIKLNGTILESNNELVVGQWKKKGHKEFKGKQQKEQQQKELDTVHSESEEAEKPDEGQEKK